MSICKNCGKEFVKDSGNQKYCKLKECRHDRKLKSGKKERLKKYGYKGYATIKCHICGKEFKKITSTNKYCSDKCSKVARNMRQNKLQKEYHKKNKRNPEYLAKRKLRLIIGKLINTSNKRKTFDIINYTAKDFVEHIEGLFQDGMSWDNYGEWHVDHIKPLCLFNFTDKNGDINYSEIERANSLKNLQPLWAKDNMSKGSKYDT